MSPNTKKSNRPKWIIFFLILSLSLLGLYAHQANQRRMLDNKLQSYRDQGLPATSAELEIWHKYPPDNQNAALVLIKAAQQFVKWDPKDLPRDPNVQKMYPLTIPDSNRSDTPPPDWSHKNFNLLPVLGDTSVLQPGDSLSPKTCIIVADFLNDNAQALNTLHQIPDFNLFRIPADYSLGGNAIFPADGFNTASSILLLESLYHLENQKPDRTIPCIISIMNIAQLCNQEPAYPYYQLSLRYSAQGIQSLEYVLNRYPLNPGQLRTIASALTDLQTAPGLSLFLLYERCFTSDEIYSNNWEYFSMYDKGLDTFTPFLDFLGFIDDDHLLFLESMDRLEAALKLPFEQRLQIAQSINKEISELSDFHLLIKSQSVGLDIYDRTFENDLRHHARLHSALTALAIENYRLDHNHQLPDTLTDLIPDYLDTIPPDPFDGLPIKYQKTNPGYLVYSIGPNLTDNGGLPIDPHSTSKPTAFDFTFTVKRK